MERKVDAYKDLLNGAESSRFFGVSETTFRKWVSLGKVKPSELSPNGKKLFNKKDLILILEPHRYEYLFKEMIYFEDLLNAIADMDKLIATRFNGDDELFKLNGKIDDLACTLRSISYNCHDCVSYQ